MNSNLKGLLKNLPSSPDHDTGWPWTKEIDPAIYTKISNWPKITIVTPSFNQGQFIEETIRSVLLQNYPNLEYIIIDGASSDNSQKIIEKYSPWISYWISQPDSGQSHAINKGLERATGEYFNWLNSDDSLNEKSLFHMGIHFLENEFDVVYGNWKVINKIGAVIKKPKSDRLNLRFLYEFPICQPATFYKTEIVIEVDKIDESIHFAMDYDLIVKCFINFKFGYIDKVIAKFRLQDASKSSSSKWGKVWREDNWRVFSKLLRTFDLHREISYLRSFKMYVEGDDRYPSLSKKNNLKHQVKSSFGHFAGRFVHYFYENLDFANVRRIIKYLKINHRPIYDQLDLHQLYFRTFFPKFLIKNLRKTKRQLFLQ